MRSQHLRRLGVTVAPASTFDRRRCCGLSTAVPSHTRLQEDAGRSLAVKRCKSDSLLFAGVATVAPPGALAEEATVSQ